MLHPSTIILIITFLFGISNRLSAHVALDYPHGGETFTEGQSILIQWHIVAFHETLNWDLLFSSNGGVDWTPIQMDIIYDSLSYTWIVPSTFSSQCRIRVIQDNVAQDYWGTSTDFTILPDTSPPSLDAPAMDALFECNTATQTSIQAWLDNHGGAVVTNHCGELTWTHDYDGLSNGCGATGSDLVIFTATDDCGSTFTIAEVSVVDSQPPNINVSPQNLAVECDGQGNAVALNQWLNNHGGAQASDACGNVVWTHNTPILSNGCGASGSTLVIFFATDECGNSTSASASFHIMDSTSPFINVSPHDTIIECSATADQAIQLWLNNHGGAQAIDICGNVSWTNNFSGLIHTCGAAGTASVTFTATDECGNSKTTFASLTLSDTQAPVVTVGAQSTNIQCGDPETSIHIQNWLDQHGGAQSIDGCGNVSWTNNYSGLSDDCGATGSAPVIFTCSDECGNSSTTGANLNVIDTIRPVIENAAMDTTIYCGSPDLFLHIWQWLDRHGGAQVSDACSSIIWTNNFPLSADSCVAGTYPVTFTAFDECLNINTTTTLFTVLDTLSTLSTSLPEPDFKVYPNPASDWLTVDLGSNENLPVRVTLIDVCGKVIWTEKKESALIRIPVIQFGTGLYFLRLEKGKGVSTKKVVIQ
jgi:hypothetical protein